MKAIGVTAVLLMAALFGGAACAYAQVTAQAQLNGFVRDQSGQEVSRWMFRQAWVTKYIGPSLRALGNEVAIETLELAHEGMELEEA